MNLLPDVPRVLSNVLGAKALLKKNCVIQNTAAVFISFVFHYGNFMQIIIFINRTKFFKIIGILGKVWWQ